MKSLIDASVVIKWVVAEADSDRATDWQTVPLAAPDFLMIELSNILWKKARRGEIVPVQAVAAMAQVEAVLELLPIRGFEVRAFEIGLELGHSIYDCLYLAIAERLETTLLTADTKLVKACAGTSFARRVMPLA